MPWSYDELSAAYMEMRYLEVLRDGMWQRCIIKSFTPVVTPDGEEFLRLGIVPLLGEYFDGYVELRGIEEINWRLREREHDQHE